MTMTIAPAIKPAPDAAPIAIPSLAPLLNAAAASVEALGIKDEEPEPSASAASLMLSPFDNIH